MKTKIQPATQKSITLALYPAKVYRYLMYMVLTFSFASVAVQFSRYFLGHRRLFGLSHQFYLDNEGTIPTYFSAVLLLICAALLMTMAALDQRQHKAYWRALSFIFLYVSLDEMISLHEQLILPMGKMFHATDWFYFAWVIPGFAVVVLLGMIFLKFILQLPKNTRTNFMISAALYIGGALGVELIGGNYAYNYGLKDFTYSMITTIEETLEMAGAALFIYALLQYLSRHITPQIKVRLLDKPSPYKVTKQPINRPLEEEEKCLYESLNT